MINQAKTKAILSEQNELKSLQQKMEEEVRSLDENIQTVKKEISEVKKFIENLLDKYPWLDPSEQYEIDAGFNY